MIRMNMDRVAIHFGSGGIFWYGIFVAAGFAVGMIVLQWRGSKNSVGANRAAELLVPTIVGGILGARISYVLTDLDYFLANPHKIIMITEGGLVFFGGFIGAALAVIFMSRWQHLQLWDVADLFAFAVPAGQAIGRWGCLVNGCCFGVPAKHGLRLLYPPDRGVLDIQIHKQLLPPYSQECLPVVPVQFYQSLINVAIVGVLLMLAPRLRGSGRLFAVFLMLYAVGRFLNEFNRGDYLNLYWGLTIAQVISVIMLPAGIALFCWRRPAAPDEVG